MDKQWYVVNTISGHEYKVKEKLMMRVESMGLQNSIFRVIVPEQKEVEVKNGVKKERVKKMFPGYVLIEMVMSDDVWYIVRNTQGVTGFIGSSGKGAKPIPLKPSEVDHILGNMGMSRIEMANDLKIGDHVRIIEGPFKSMVGTVQEMDLKAQKLTVALDLFGQETSVDAELAEIEKIN